MKKVVFWTLSALVIWAVALPAAAQKAAKEGVAQKTGGLSDRTVRKLATIAWANIPDEVSKPDGTRIRVRGVSVDKFLLSMEDHRRVVRIAERSAQARICGMKDLELANHAKMMKLEEDSKRWSNEQLAWIHWLHTVTVKYSAFDPSTAESRVKDLGLEGEERKAALEKMKKVKKRTCSDQMRQRVQQEIEEYVKS